MYGQNTPATRGKRLHELAKAHEVEAELIFESESFVRVEIVEEYDMIGLEQLRRALTEQWGFGM